MSHITSGILGGAAMALMMSAMQFASGSDLRATVPANATEASQVSTEAVNRSAKSDRSQVATAQDGGKTVSFRVHSLPDTSLLLRVTPTPVKVEKIAPALDTAAVQRAFKATARKSAVACEPPVSVLTEIAKLLEPGRCVT